MLGILESLRSRFTAKQATKAVEKETTWMAMVERLADGENVPLEEIEATVDSVQSINAKPVCPLSTTHRNTSVVKSGPSTRQCVCNDCAHEWTEETPANGGEWSLDRLEKDVALLQRRRELSRLVSGRAAAEAELNRCREELATAEATMKAAHAAMIATSQRLEGPLRSSEKLVQDADDAAKELQQTAGQLRPKLAHELKLLNAERAKLQRSLTDAIEDVWGGHEGTIEPYAETLGAKWLGPMRKLFDYAGGPVDLSDVAPVGDRWNKIVAMASKRPVFAEAAADYPAIFNQVQVRLRQIELLKPRLAEITNRLEAINADALNP